jgi:predicted DCC family thiol-disulfide oxidoreductase YuxK
MSAQPQSAPDPVLLYDGECGLCNRVVRFMLRLDRHGRLRYCRLQGPSGQEYLRAAGLPTEDFSTIVFVPDWTQRDRPVFKLRGKGIAAALLVCGGWGNVLGRVIAVIPTRCKDAGYSFVAGVRYRMFGPWIACPIPRPGWAKRFID